MWGKSRATREAAPSRGAAADAVATALVQCPLCGFRFEEQEGPACAYCPAAFRRCGMVACPRCSHEFPRMPAR